MIKCQYVSRGLHCQKMAPHSCFSLMLLPSNTVMSDSYTHTSLLHTYITPTHMHHKVRHTCIIKCDTHASDDPLHAQDKIMSFAGAPCTKKFTSVHYGWKRMRRGGALASERQSADVFTDGTPLQMGHVYKLDALTNRTS